MEISRKYTIINAIGSGERKVSKIILVTGAASSGKSEWAEFLAMESEKAVTYVATAQVDETDVEWVAKIAKHRCRRPQHWQTLVAQTDLTAAISTATSADCLLVDSLGTWIANLIDLSQKDWQKTVERFLKTLPEVSGEIILVAEETGWGVVPAYQIGRIFRDRAGSLSRQIGAIADTVYLVTGGHALDLKKFGTPIPHLRSTEFPD